MRSKRRLYNSKRIFKSRRKYRGKSKSLKKKKFKQSCKKNMRGGSNLPSNRSSSPLHHDFSPQNTPTETTHTILEGLNRNYYLLDKDTEISANSITLVDHLNTHESNKHVIVYPSDDLDSNQHDNLGIDILKELFQLHAFVNESKKLKEQEKKKNCDSNNDFIGDLISQIIKNSKTGKRKQSIHVCNYENTDFKNVSVQINGQKLILKFKIKTVQFSGKYTFTFSIKEQVAIQIDSKDIDIKPDDSEFYEYMKQITNGSKMELYLVENNNNNNNHSSNRSYICDISSGITAGHFVVLELAK